MNCMRCGAEMNSTTNGNYACPKCGIVVNDLEYRPQNCDTSLPQNFDKKEGWVCPVCGRGVAPLDGTEIRDVHKDMLLQCIEVWSENVGESTEWRYIFLKN